MFDYFRYTSTPTLVKDDDANDNMTYKEENALFDDKPTSIAPGVGARRNKGKITLEMKSSGEVPHFAPIDDYLSLQPFKLLSRSDRIFISK